jgi:hypothetical protein
MASASCFIIPPSTRSSSSSSSSSVLVSCQQRLYYHHYQQQQKSHLNNSNNSNNNSNNSNNNKKKRKYQFGDITKSIINKITDQDEYQFGDLSKHVDSQIKSRISQQLNTNTNTNTTNNNTANSKEYQFGDLTRYLVQDFTQHKNNGNNNSNSTASTSASASSSYQFGDITREIIHRVKSKQYTLQDLALLTKTLLSLGISFNPIASFLPMKILIDLLNYSILGDFSGKVIESISIEVDKRMKKAIVGDANYQIGDLTKREILKYIGKEEYSFGDISKRVMETMDEYEVQKKEYIKLKQEVVDLKKNERIIDEVVDVVDVDADVDAKVVEKKQREEMENKRRGASLLLDGEHQNGTILKEIDQWDQQYFEQLNKQNNEQKV